MVNPERGPVSLLLREIEHELRRDLGDEALLVQILREADGHLSECVQAHLELEYEVTEAERAAVDLFGPAERFVAQILDAHENRVRVRRVASQWVWGSTAFAAAVFVATILQSPLTEIRHALWAMAPSAGQMDPPLWRFALVMLPLAGVAVTSYRARCAKLGTSLKATLVCASLTWIVLSCGWLLVPNSDEPHLIARWSTKGYLVERSEQATWLRSESHRVRDASMAGTMLNHASYLDTAPARVAEARRSPLLPMLALIPGLGVLALAWGTLLLLCANLGAAVGRLRSQRRARALEVA